jgi:hypothetical protein
MNDRMRWSLVVLYAAAMAWVEAAVVVYLRVLIDRVEPYQPDPLPAFIGLGQIELARELATLIMIGAVAGLAGRTWRGRAGYSMSIFGMWDILYYIFLRPMSQWPRSLLDWDILFLVPLPWWAPVLAPCMIALLLVLTGTIISRCDASRQPLWPGRRAWAVSGVGVAVALYTFMADAIAAMSGGMETIRQVLPAEFNWPLFSVALVLLAAPLADMTWQSEIRRESGRVVSPMPLPRRTLE